MKYSTLLADALGTRQRLIAFGCLVLVASVLPVAQGTPGKGVLLLAIIAISIAVWHGAFDHMLARPVLRPRLGRRWWPVFLAGYVTLACAVAVLWWRLPVVALVLFLTYSAWHFGTEMEVAEMTPLASTAAWCLGFLPIAAACFWHPAAVAAIFDQIARSPRIAPEVARICGLLLFPAVAIVLLGVLTQRVRPWRLLILIALELLLFSRCSPVIAFTIFFCFWHTPEHLVASSTSFSGKLSIRRMLLQLRSGLLPWCISLAGLAVLLAVLLASGAQRLEAYSAEVFILLSAHTVPHMLLNEARRAANLSHLRFAQGSHGR